MSGAPSSPVDGDGRRRHTKQHNGSSTSRRSSASAPGGTILPSMTRYGREKCILTTWHPVYLTTPCKHILHFAPYCNRPGVSDSRWLSQQQQQWQRERLVSPAGSQAPITRLSLHTSAGARGGGGGGWGGGGIGGGVSYARAASPPLDVGPLVVFMDTIMHQSQPVGARGGCGRIGYARVANSRLA